MKWNTWLLCFYTHSCESFKIVQIKIQKGQIIRIEMNSDYYAFILVHVRALKKISDQNEIVFLVQTKI